MALTKLVCPECSKVLRPARPVAPGKKVRCPKCEFVFVAGEDEDEDDAEEEEERPKKKKPAAKAAAPAKKAPPAKKPADGEEEEGAYGIAGGGEEDDEGKPKISYAPDSSVKDLRGPAVAIVTPPTNLLIRSGFIGVFGCIVLLLLLAIPALLPVSEDDRPESRQPLPMMKIDPGFAKVNPPAAAGPGPNMGGGGGGSGDNKKEKLEEEESYGYVVYRVDWGGLCELHWTMFLLAMIPIVLLGVYSGLVASGGIKAQNLESRGWGITSSIMAMFPLNTFCANVALTMIFQCAVYMILDVSDDLAVFLVWVWLVINHLIYPLSLGAGIWTLVTLNKEEVIAGFEYEGE
jgi:uncharacterized Zn finger protein (UPF0148 family)